MNFIDLESSYSFFGVNKADPNTWRASILAVVFDHDDNKYYYLTKECIAEHIQNDPDDHPGKNPFYTLWGFFYFNFSMKFQRSLKTYRDSFFTYFLHSVSQ